MKNFSLLLLALFWMTTLFAQETDEEFTPEQLEAYVAAMDSIEKAIYKPALTRQSVQHTGGESMPVNGDQMLKYQHEWWSKAATGEVSVEEALKNLEQDVAAISP